MMSQGFHAMRACVMLLTDESQQETAKRPKQSMPSNQVRILRTSELGLALLFTLEREGMY
jgi:hypothetical protein